MNFKNLSKKITATLAAGVIGLSITFSVPKNVEAFGIGDAINIGGAILQGNAQMKEAQQQIEIFNNTEEGRQALYQQYREQCGVNSDPTLNSRLKNIMDNLTNAVKATDPSDKSIDEKPYLYFVSADKNFNAFCSFGHVMTVNTGAFENVATDDEIAAIVGHEMGHGQRDHVAKGTKKRINKQMLANIGVSAAGGSTLAAAIGTIALTNSVAHGDRKNETEADNLAWEYMLHTNYNIGACAAVMQRLAEIGGEKNKSTIFNPSDHPDTGKRRDNYATKLYEYSGKHASARDGVVTVNGKTFLTVAATSNMSSAERAFFVLGNLAKAYHEGKNSNQATVSNGTVYLGSQAIITPTANDESASELAARLNEIK